LDPIRGARRGTLIIFIIAHFALTAVVNLVFFAGNAFRPLASATGGLLTGSLIANLIFIAVLVGVIIVFGGRLRLSDLGLAPRRLPADLLAALGLWSAAQIIHLAAGWWTSGTVAINPEWMERGAGFMLGLLLMQIVGNALFEEIAYRGFLLPQLYLRLTRLAAHPWARLLSALLISQAAFALSHIPNRIYLGMTPTEIGTDLLMLLGWGAFYSLIYLRSGSLLLVVAVHALGNAPTTVFASAPQLIGGGESLLIYALALLAIFVIPALRRAVRPRLDADLIAEAAALEQVRGFRS
jgi:membrane protease YdiL (CAAX protease family)